MLFRSASFYRGSTLSKILMPSTTLHCRLSISNQKVHSSFIAEDKDVAGMAEQTPRIKLFLAGACVSPDWSEKPVEQLMPDALALR